MKPLQFSLGNRAQILSPRKKERKKGRKKCRKGGRKRRHIIGAEIVALTKRA